jgi:hypothetical protein
MPPKPNQPITPNTANINNITARAYIANSAKTSKSIFYESLNQINQPNIIQD